MADEHILTDGVVRLGSEYVNWYLVADDSGVTIVDTGLPGYRPQLDRGLSLLGRSPDDLRAVVLTHGDADHTGVASKLAEEWAELPIHIHPDDRRLVQGKQKNTEESQARLVYRPQIIRLLGHFVRNGAGLRPPRVDSTAGLIVGETLDVPGGPSVIGTPGHTDGHVGFHFPKHGALFVGDSLCTWNPGDNKRGPQLMRPAFNVSNTQALESLSAYEGIEAGLLLPGHGEPWTEGVDAALAGARATAAGLDPA